VDFGAGLVVLFWMMVFYGAPFSAAMLLIPGFLLLAIATAFGAGVWLATFNVMYRDVRYTVPFLIQIWMFASPVIYPSNLVPGRWQWLYGLNPMVGVIEGFRWALLGQKHPPLELGFSVLVVLSLIFGGVIYFNRMTVPIADTV
jgi:lipopolysaccharide transport system permease protein